ncbi:MAG: hypothetical protein QNK37_24465 [Acidobacteriota bacterium]|nr:hypothetical protein [Acidobacteriota bacterium]
MKCPSIVFLCLASLVFTYAQDTSRLPEKELLNVIIPVFDPGLPPDDEDALEDKGVFAWVRKSEARTIPMEIMRAMQDTKRWGVIRVVPANYTLGEVRIHGKINYATGLRMVLSLQVEDATGNIWLKKKYRMKADPTYFSRFQGAPYARLFARIAEDLIKALSRLDKKQAERIRTVNDMRFAAELAPEVFGGYLKTRKRGKRTIYSLERLPAAGDPTLTRLTAIRDRDNLLVDTFSDYYADYRVRAQPHYTEWLLGSRNEELRLEQVKKANRRGNDMIYRPPTAESRHTRTARGPAREHEQARKRWAEEEKFKKALAGLAEAMTRGVEPLQVELKGRTVKLTGSAEARYSAWRELLTEVFYLETGLQHSSER